MARQTNLLDDVEIRHWVAKGEPVAKSDGEGLTFTLSRAGTATWILRYRRGGGRRKELTLGNYPDMTLAAARKAARAHRVSIDNGIDPAAEKQAEKARSVAAWTVAQLCDNYEEKILVPPLSHSTTYYRKWDIANILKPKIGTMEVRNVMPADIVHMVESSGRSWTVCKRILTSAKQIFAHACGKRMIDANPCVGIDIKAIKGQRPPVKKRVMLAEQELRALLPNIDETIGRENALALRILLATCVRTNELVKARKQHIDLDRGTWWIEADSVKTRAGFQVPLVPSVALWMRELLALSGDSEWLLPARGGMRRNRLGDTHIGNTTLWAAITRAYNRGGIEGRKFTPHDTRSTAKSHMRNMGIPNEITEIALNHKLKGMEAIYDVREEIPERRRALEVWAAFITSCAEGGEWNVVPFKAA
ncbi:integrase [Pandoraea terrae]|uniref:Integrase n=1 Tax=Pandoraea terrae TaxID=1537710 RepID=A0A5E4U7E4_9BURK|nr:site-specific integrase [Pandoraea terrae]VVD94139.1 integrase [Pandoraea terrae]